MKTKKMSLANIQGKLSRAEMKNIMAGSGGGNPTVGICLLVSGGMCVCSNGIGDCGWNPGFCQSVC